MRYIWVLTGGIDFVTAGVSLTVIDIAQQAHATPFAIGLIFGVASLAGVLPASIGPWLRKRYSFVRIVLVSLWALLLFWPAFALASNSVLLGVVLTLVITASITYDLAQFSYRLQLIPDNLQGRINSIYRLLVFGVQPLGIALTGFLLQALGPTPTVLAFFLPLIVLVLLATFNPHLRAGSTASEQS